MHSVIQLVELHPSEQSDILVEWLKCLKIWEKCTPYLQKLKQNPSISVLSIEGETVIREILGLPLDQSMLIIFGDLLQSSTGLNLKKMCDQQLFDDPSTCTGRLIQLKLARLQDNIRFKPLVCAFDPRIQYLIGYKTKLC